MIAACDNQLRVRHSLPQQLERLNHEFEPLVGSPLAKSENAMGIAATREVRKLWSSGKDAVGTKMDVIAPVFIVEDLAISRHENGYGVCKQQHARCDCTCAAIEPLMPNAGIFQIDGVHEVMQGDVRIASAQAGEQRSGEAAESNQGIMAEGAEQKVEPYNVGLQLVDRPDQTESTSRIIERPAALDLQARRFLMWIWKFIRQDGQAKEGVALKFLRDVKSVLA